MRSIFHLDFQKIALRLVIYIFPQMNHISKGLFLYVLKLYMCDFNIFLG